ncbi:MAG: hypothetical protein HOM96_02410 [Rickettsiales bacterium]|jgi:hypothetical protein|nr:hypothetical protein [Rickettsiales bacterium]
MLKYLLIFITIANFVLAEDKVKIEKLQSAYSVDDGLYRIQDKEGYVTYFFKKGEEFVFSDSVKIEDESKNTKEG